MDHDHPGRPWSGSEGMDEPLQNGQMKVYPNPADHFMDIRFFILGNDHATLSLLNAQGKQIAILYDGETLSGDNIIRRSTGNLPPGIYYCRLQTRQTTEVVKVMVVR